MKIGIIIAATLCGFTVLTQASALADDFIPVCSRSLDAQAYILEYVNQAYNTPWDVAYNPDLCRDVQPKESRKFSKCEEISQKELEISSACYPWYFSTRYSEVNLVVRPGQKFKRGDFSGVVIRTVSVESSGEASVDLDPEVFTTESVSKLDRILLENDRPSPTLIGKGLLAGLFRDGITERIYELGIKGKFNLVNFSSLSSPNNSLRVSTEKGFDDWNALVSFLSRTAAGSSGKMEMNLDFKGQIFDPDQFGPVAGLAAITIQGAYWNLPCSRCGTFLQLVAAATSEANGGFSHLSAERFDLTGNRSYEPQSAPVHLGPGALAKSRFGSFNAGKRNSRLALSIDDGGFSEFSAETMQVVADASMQLGAFRNIRLLKPESSSIELNQVQFLSTGKGAYFSNISINDLSLSSDAESIPGALFEKVNGTALSLDFPNLKVEATTNLALGGIQTLHLSRLLPAAAAAVIGENRGIEVLTLSGQAVHLEPSALLPLKALRSLSFLVEKGDQLSVPTTVIDALARQGTLKSVLLERCGYPNVISNPEQVCSSAAAGIFKKMDSRRQCRHATLQPYCKPQ